MRVVMKAAVTVSMFVGLLKWLVLLAVAGSVAWLVWGSSQAFAVAVTVLALIALGVIDNWRKDLRAELAQLDRKTLASRRDSALRAEKWRLGR